MYIMFNITLFIDFFIFQLLYKFTLWSLNELFLYYKYEKFNQNLFIG